MKLISSFLVMALLIATTLAGQDSQTIRRGQSMRATLASDSEHRYTIDLGENTFVYGHADQLSVDVVVRVLDPDGDAIRSFDSPDRGPEKFTFETEAQGTYVIEVTPFEQATGDYELEIFRTERVASNPRDRVDQLMMPFSDNATPGAVVGVVQQGRLRFVRGYGMANLSHSIEFDDATVSNIGSITKQFTAMGLLLLQADGKLSLQDDIREHIPELPDFGVPITLKNLLNHTGGYRELYNLMPMTGYDGEDALASDIAIRIVQRQPDLQAQPNTEFNYNNTGYLLLAETIRRVTEMEFPDFIKERIFTPLGMLDTRVKSYQGEIIPGSAQGYVPAPGGGYRSTRDLAASAGAGGIYTTVADLSKWMLNYRDRTIGGDAAIFAITSKAILESGDSTNYGLGLGIATVRGRRLFTHTGGDVAHRAYLGYYPDFDGGVLVLSNNGSFNLGVANQIAEAFFEDDFEPEEDEEETTVASGKGMSAERIAAVAGDWKITPTPTTSQAIVYSIEDGDLFAQVTGQPQIELTPTSDSTAEFQGPEASVTFHFKTDGTVDSATHHQGGSFPMVRVNKVTMTAEDLMSFTGRYYSTELETAFDIRFENDTLTMHNLRMPSRPLKLQEKDTFTAGPFPFATIAFERTGNGQVTGFMASNDRTRNVWFSKEH